MIKETCQSLEQRYQHLGRKISLCIRGSWSQKRTISAGTYTADRRLFGPLRAFRPFDTATLLLHVRRALDMGNARLVNDNKSIVCENKICDGTTKAPIIGATILTGRQESFDWRRNEAFYFVSLRNYTRGNFWTFSQMRPLISPQFLSFL